MEKIWDYTKESRKWTGTNHKRRVHHISRSGIEWCKASDGIVPSDVSDRILHAILAHHGRREWGSPVAPKTRMAWMLHLADSMSARMNDADTNDLIK